jgi:hypothetical protein
MSEHAVTPDIELQPDERSLLDQIYELAGGKNEKQRERNLLIGQLMAKLLDRDAIPAVRLAQFNDPDRNYEGGNRSHNEVFARNGTSGRDILSHGNFERYFWYMIGGPDLPPSVRTSFAQAIQDCGMVTSGDIDPLGKEARRLTRANYLEPRPAAAEFFRLCLEKGLSPPDARCVQKAVQQIRT